VARVIHDIISLSLVRSTVAPPLFFLTFADEKWAASTGTSDRSSHLPKIDSTIHVYLTKCIHVF
jgi:hypothetical protein